MSAYVHTEKELLRKLGQGDSDAFREVFLSHYPVLCGFAEKISGDRDEAEDIVSDVFFNLLQSPRQFINLVHFRGYLFRSIRNTHLNRIRSHQRSSERHTAFSKGLEEPDADFLGEVIRAETYLQLRMAIAALPSQAAAIITKTYLEGMSNQEVADELGISVNTVKSQKQRGLRILRDRLPKESWMLLLFFSYWS